METASASLAVPTSVAGLRAWMVRFVNILFFAAFFVFPVTAQDIVYFIRRQRNRTLRAGTPCFLYLFFCREQAQLP
jgi:hypothetical protein